MLSDRMRALTRDASRFFASLFGKIGLTPNALTVIGYFLTLPVVYVLATGRLQLGGVLVALSSLFDSLDGALARETGQVTKFGAFFDSVMDRYSESTIFFGLFLWYTRTQNDLALALIYVTLVGSLMVSYARARAEGLDMECKVGWFSRFERIALLSLALFFNLAIPALWVMAIMTNVTAMQRVHHIWRTARVAPVGEDHA